MNPSPAVVLFGASIIDIPAGPVDSSVFSSGSHPVERIAFNFGGDALNEATVLARLGHEVRLVSVVGDDDAGRLVLNYCATNGIDTQYVSQRTGMDTGINLVLVSPGGERSFITSNSGGLRAPSPTDIPLSALDGAKLLCFASIFVFPRFRAAELETLFLAAKQRGLVLCADMTKPKNNETLPELRRALQHLDYFFPNYEEACLLSGKTTLDDIADAFLSCGVKHIAIKTGKNGCFLKYAGFRGEIPAISGVKSVDTTGAGDSFSAGFLCALLEGKSPPECARFANAAASLSIETFGATSGIQNRAQVEKRLARYRASSAP